MKNLLLLLLVVTALIAPQSATAGFVRLNFNGFVGDPSATINFAGDRTFQFSNPNTFEVSASAADPASLVAGHTSVGLIGSIIGKFEIGACGACTTTTVSTVGPTAELKIKDGNGIYLTANVDWKSISQADGQAQEGLNLGNVINLTNIAYAGTNTDLLAFANYSPDKSGFVNVNWTVDNLSQTIEYWATHNTTQDSFSGLMRVTPEPGFYGALAVGLSGLFVVLRRKRA